MRGLTPRQRAALDFIREFTRTRGFPPSVRELAGALGLRSSSVAYYHLAALEKKGYVRRSPFRPRTIEVLRNPDGLPAKRAVKVPLVRPSRPDSATLLQPAGEIVLPSDFAPSGSVATVVDSAGEGAGVRPGDLLVVAPRTSPQPGALRAVLTDGRVSVERSQTPGAGSAPGGTVLGTVCGLIRILDPDIARSLGVGIEADQEVKSGAAS